jgi:hypothetical protein
VHDMLGEGGGGGVFVHLLEVRSHEEWCEVMRSGGEM